MKIIAFILVFITVQLFGQDLEMIDFINQYRKSNGKTVLIFNKNLSKISANQNNIVSNQDSLSHSNITSEIAVMGKRLPATIREQNAFINFLDKNFNITYKEPKNDNEVITYTKLYIIYMFDLSSNHKSILLDDYKTIGFDIIIKDIILKTNTIIVNGEKHVFKNMLNHYNVKFYCVINFKR